MTLSWILLAAHYRHTEASGTLEETVETGCEPVGGGNHVVEHVAVLVVHIGLQRSSTQLAAQKYVPESGLLE